MLRARLRLPVLQVGQGSPSFGKGWITHPSHPTPLHITHTAQPKPTYTTPVAALRSTQPLDTLHHPLPNQPNPYPQRHHNFRSRTPPQHQTPSSYHTFILALKVKPQE